ncbi:KAP family P-loop NTPase fold protein [Pseudogemmobacter bohemicus]|uniref:KAP family P-loop NTPase fold protein n=1 Tax=Pseudogemmobacter bohemicus TaxID=2250708 RepID=UPI00130045E0|nr:P-loop NTPase fold protein [Pseudogemmobacter bohemicus]
MKDLEGAVSPWKDDGLGYAAIGDTFTSLIKSIDDSKVISIEAGFGHGKTFFRRAWAQQLRASGELVIEIDAQQSDRTDDPIITFMGALLKAQPVSGKPLAKTLKDGSLKIAGIAARSLTRAVLRSGADVVLGAVSDWVQEQTPDIGGLDKAVEELETGMSKVAYQLIATHLAAETARIEELPIQIDKLRDALTEGAASDRIIIIVDELDRCHPEYAIALLEAMKLVFGRNGFVFCLMVNPHYLENIARHRFGPREGDELYLDKFVDLRLALRTSPEIQGLATAELVRQIPIAISFGQSEHFSVEAAATLSKEIVKQSGFSFRQIKRTIERVDLVARIYRGVPIDPSLLVLMAFSDVAPERTRKHLSLPSALLKRSSLTPEGAKRLMDGFEFAQSGFDRQQLGEAFERCRSFVGDACPELVDLAEEMYQLSPQAGQRSSHEWYKVLKGLGPTYIPSHRAMLDGVQSILAD